MLQPYEAVLIAVGTTAIGSVALIEYLFRALRGVLAACQVDEPLARFWAALARVVVLLLPVSFELFALGLIGLPPSADWFWVVSLIKWGLLGLVFSVAMIGLAVLLFAQGRSVQLWVPPSQAAEMQRMLDRVRELRAREIVAKAEQIDVWD